MPIDSPPPPPQIEQPAESVRGQAPIADMRDKFGRKTPPTSQDEAQARAFIDGKIDMIRRDQRMTEAEKAVAIQELKTRR
jgi:hypothetical protein